jgi:hypothetical protein
MADSSETENLSRQEPLPTDNGDHNAEVVVLATAVDTIAGQVLKICDVIERIATNLNIALVVLARQQEEINELKKNSETKPPAETQTPAANSSRTL